MKQSVLEFAILEPAAPVVPWVGRPVAATRRRGGELDAEAWYELGCELEPASVAESVEAYRCALVLDGGHADAHLNLGRLLHQSGDLEAAERHYRRALAARPDDATAAFNLGVALQDLGRPRLAIETYLRAIVLHPGAADAHFNLAGLYQRLGERASALRHLKRYKSLTAT